MDGRAAAVSRIAGPGQRLDAVGAPTSRDVLLIAHTTLSLRYVREHYELLAADPRLRFTITRAHDEMSGGVDNAIAQLMETSRRLGAGREVQQIDFNDATSRRWDLALFGTHGSRDFLRDDIPCVHIQHGIGAGKVAEGDDFTYGPRWTLYPMDHERAGEPFYDVMLEASHAVRARAVRGNPALADRIKVVGDLPADRLLLTDAHRDRYRNVFGIQSDQKALLLISTWGPHGLMGPAGEKGIPLLEQAIRLGDYRVILSMHPHLWHQNDGTTPDTWKRRLSKFGDAGLVVCPPDASWAPYLAAADIAIIDHGSLCLYYGLLMRPSIAVPVPDNAVNPGAPIAALRAASPKLTNAADLADVVDHAFRTFDPGLMPGRESITSYPGQAAERTREHLYRLMKLPLPHEALAMTYDVSPAQFPLHTPSRHEAYDVTPPTTNGPASSAADRGIAARPTSHTDEPRRPS